MSKTIVTHNGSFHTDDIFAVATLLMLEPEAKVSRTRDASTIEGVDYVADVGLIYNPAERRFDHHQTGGAGERENGIPYASFGLVWKEYGQSLAGGPREAEIIDRELISPIDAHDNGVAIAEYRFAGVRDYAIGDFFSSYLSAEDDGEERIYEIFMKLVDIAKELLKREIKKAREAVSGEDQIEEIYTRTQDKRIIELPSDRLPWREVLNRFPEPLYVMYPRSDGNWSVKAVPDLSKPYGHNRRSFPSVWGGKSAEELKRITGVPDAIFAHRASFMCVAASHDGALALARKALEA